MVALRDSCETFRGSTNRLDVAMVKVADLGAVVEQHAVAQPVESVREHDLALRARGSSVEVDDRANSVTEFQVDLAGVRSGECVWLPERHVSILADEAVNHEGMPVTGPTRWQNPADTLRPL